MKKLFKRITAGAQKAGGHIFNWLDVIFLTAGIVLVAIGAFQIYIPAGFIITGLCFSALSFFIAKKQASGR